MKFKEISMGLLKPMSKKLLEGVEGNILEFADEVDFPRQNCGEVKDGFCLFVFSPTSVNIQFQGIFCTLRGRIILWKCFKHPLCIDAGLTQTIMVPLEGSAEDARCMGWRSAL